MNQRFQYVLERIAAENRTSVDEVYRQMQIAIDAGFDSPDPQVRKNWECIPYKGERPTPEEFVVALASMISPSGGYVS